MKQKLVYGIKVPSISQTILKLLQVQHTCRSPSVPLAVCNWLSPVSGRVPLALTGTQTLQKTLVLV